ncbi:Leucyl-tRNA synthetase, mitochondrial, partial [Kickxella alabastrina]
MVHGLTHKDPETGRFLRPNEVDLSGAHPRVRATGQRPTVSYEKMSKSKYNGVAPGDAVEAFGADATRLHMLYLAPPQDVLEWDTQSIVGMQRWINRLGRLMDSTCGAARASDAGLLPLDLADGREKWSPEARETFRMCNIAVQRVTDALQRTYAFNSAIAALIELSNYLGTVGDRSHPTFRHALLTLVKMLSPMAPGVGEELWEIAHENYLLPYSESSSSGGNSGVVRSVFDAQWPVLDESALVADTTTVVVQINGKMRFKMERMPVGMPEEELLGAVRNHSASVKWLVDP